METRNAISRRAKTIVSRSACLHDAQLSQEIGHRRLRRRRRRQPPRGWRRQAGCSQSTAGLLSRGHPSNSTRNAGSDRLPLRVPTRCPIFSRNWALSNFRRGVNARSCGEEDARGTGCGAMEVPWLFPPEVFPANRRPSAHSWAGISTWHRGRAARLL